MCPRKGVRCQFYLARYEDVLRFEVRPVLRMRLDMMVADRTIVVRSVRRRRHGAKKISQAATTHTVALTLEKLLLPFCPGFSGSFLLPGGR